MAETTLLYLQIIGHHSIINEKKFQFYPFFRANIYINSISFFNFPICLSLFRCIMLQQRSNSPINFDAFVCSSWLIRSVKEHTLQCALCTLFQNIVSESQSSQSVCTLHFVWLKWNGSFITWLGCSLFDIFETRFSLLIVRLIFFFEKNKLQLSSFLEFLRQMFVLYCMRCNHSRFNRLSLTANICVLCCNAADRKKCMVWLFDFKMPNNEKDSNWI